MPVVCFSETQFRFPPLHQADEEGLLVIGGRVTPERVLEAYPKGIFPWYNDDIPLWWSPDPRFVLFPGELHVSRNMKKTINKGAFRFEMNTSFNDVITACSSVPRNGQDGTWITPEMKAVYNELHQQGFAHSAETWLDGRLVGGMYGIRIGNVFFGESMFSYVPNASKFAFIQYVQQLARENLALLDCQVYTPHVESLGARLISRQAFVDLLRRYC